MTARDHGLPVLRTIVGPTAAGKSSLAMQLAEAVGAAIISADSRQVYRGFDVGTAKPSDAERTRVPHFGIDIVDPAERISADEWARRVPAWVNATRDMGRAPLLVGGTGFYLRALFEPLFDAPPVDAEHRQRLVRHLETLPVGELRRWCESIDPARASLGRTQLLRAIETALLTGRRLSVWHAASPRAPSFAARYLLVDPGRALAGRIEARVGEMLQLGWVAEIERLMRVVPQSAPAWSATGYGVLRSCVEGTVSSEAAVERIVIETRQYAKRQRTWFRNQLDASRVTVVNPTDTGALQRTLAWWHGENV